MSEQRVGILQARMGKHNTREKAHDGLKNTTGPCRGKGEFKGSPRQVYGGQSCKFNTESSLHLICSKRGVMNLPFRNASAIKHCREDVQPGWMGGGGLLPPPTPGSEGMQGGARGCLALGGPGKAAEPFPHQPATSSPGSCFFKRAHWGPSLPSPVRSRSWAGSLLMHRGSY